MVEVSKSIKYTLCQENIPIFSKGKPVQVTGQYLQNKQLQNYLTDKRLNLCSFENKNTLEEYLRYLSIFVDAVQRYIIDSERPASKQILSILKMGYVPYWVPPTFTQMTDRIELINALQKSGDNFIKQDPYRIDGSIVAGANKDIYVSRVSMMKRLGVKRPQDVSISKYIEVLLNA